MDVGFEFALHHDCHNILAVDAGLDSHLFVFFLNFYADAFVKQVEVVVVLLDKLKQSQALQIVPSPEHEVHPAVNHYTTTFLHLMKSLLLFNSKAIAL